jgi:hypothetical protein
MRYAVSIDWNFRHFRYLVDATGVPAMNHRMGPVQGLSVELPLVFSRPRDYGNMLQG